MKKLFLAWLLGAFTFFGIISLIANADGRTVIELSGIIMLVVILNLAIFLLWYIGEQ